MDSRVVVTAEDFSVGDEYDYLAQGTAAGAVVTFVGKVRDMNLGVGFLGLLQKRIDPPDKISVHEKRGYGDDQTGGGRY